MQAVKRSGLRCPEDISVVGFDDLEISAMTDPPLFTVSQSGYELGATAMKLLVNRVADAAGPARHIVLKTDSKIRGSVALVSSDEPKAMPKLNRRREPL